MKHAMLSFLMLVTCILANAQNGMLTPKDRKFAIEYFEKTKQRLLKDVKGLSEAQLNYKTDSSRWSITRCIEHIALAENGLWQWCTASLKNDTSSLKKPEHPMSDEQIIMGVTDRSQKRKAPEMLQPKDQFPDERTALNAFIQRRDSTMQYLKTTKDALRSHYMQTPAGVVDVYQGFLLLAAHSERHTLQIEEVMKDANFPRK